MVGKIYVIAGWEESITVHFKFLEMTFYHFSNFLLPVKHMYLHVTQKNQCNDAAIAGQTPQYYHNTHAWDEAH